MDFNVCVVIVTYNRLEKLKKTLAYYDKQLLLPKRIVVVNNASTDDTSEFLTAWEKETSSYKKTVINMLENTGGAGGFYEGEKFALQLNDINWVMIADDDAYPTEDYLLGMNNFILNNTSKNIALVCGRVEQNGTSVNIHRSFWISKWNWNFHVYVPECCYNRTFFEPDFVSYIGIIIRKDVLDKAGLVNKDFFIWNDDTEHSFRMKKFGRFICIPQYYMYHDVDIENNQLSWKTYYSYRNKTVFFKKHLKVQFVFVIGLLFIKSLLCPLKGKSMTESKLRITAILNGVLGKLGKHHIYKPGWKP